MHDALFQDRALNEVLDEEIKKILPEEKIILFKKEH